MFVEHLPGSSSPSLRRPAEGEAPDRRRQTGRLAGSRTAGHRRASRHPAPPCPFPRSRRLCTRKRSAELAHEHQHEHQHQHDAVATTDASESLTSTDDSLSHRGSRRVPAEPRSDRPIHPGWAPQPPRLCTSRTPSGVEPASPGLCGRRLHEGTPTIGAHLPNRPPTEQLRPGWAHVGDRFTPAGPRTRRRAKPWHRISPPSPRPPPDSPRLVHPVVHGA